MNSTDSIDTERMGWLKERRRGIGSSDAAAVLGLSDRRQPYQVYLNKIGELPDDQSDERMEWGLKLEEAIATSYKNIKKRPVELPPARIMWHPTIPYLLASLDRVTWIEGRPAVLECKNIEFDKDWGEPGTDQVAPYYLCQVQHQMQCSGYHHAEVAMLLRGAKAQFYHVPADPIFQQRANAIYADFWKRVEDRNPPPLDWNHPSTPALVARIYGSENATEVPLSWGAVQLAKEYLKIKEEMSALKKRKELIKAQIVSETQGAAIARGDGVTYKRTLVKRAGYSVEPTEYFDVRIKENG